ncbi:hypothetical protein V5799_013472 [Amblyomma americanum]|uniref:Myb-like domain-containing protein n=1 Tax=Amblyomma americanum TaxID=6943 RepID=A0AAQ4E5S8_AMBAM
MGSLDDNSVYEADSEDCAHRESRRRKKRSSACTSTPACEVGEAFTDESDTVGKECLEKEPISLFRECAYESKTEKKKKYQRRKKCESATDDNCAYAESEQIAEKSYSNLSHITQVSDDTREARHRHKKYKKGKTLRDSDSDDNEIEDVPCVVRSEQTDVKKEDQSVAELEECGNIDEMVLERKKRKNKKPFDTEDRYSNLNHRTQISDDIVDARHKHKKHKKVETLRDSESAGNEIEDVPCVMQYEQTDVKKEDQSVAELEECGNIDEMVLERKKRKNKKPFDTEDRYSNLNHRTEISDDIVDARRKHKKHKKVETLRDSESAGNEIEDVPCVMQYEQTDVEKEDQLVMILLVHATTRAQKVETLRDSESVGNEIEDVPCVMQYEQTDVEKEDQSVAELEECGNIDEMVLERKKRKNKKPFDTEDRYSNLNHRTQISDDIVGARHKHKKHKKVETLRDSESAGNEIEDVPCVMQYEQTDVEKEDQSVAELEECGKMDNMGVKRKKRKKKKPCDAEYSSCRDEIDLLFSDENLSSTPGRVHKKKKYKATVERLQADSGSAVSDLQENCADKHSTFSGESDRILSDDGNQNCNLRTPHKRKKREVAKEYFQEGASCSFSDQQMDGCGNTETCRHIDDGHCCSTGAVHKKKPCQLKLAAECADCATDCALSCPTEELCDNASFIGVGGENAQMGSELENQSETSLGTSLRELGESPLKRKGSSHCITQEHSGTQQDLGIAFKKKKRKLARLSAFGDELFCTPSLQADADSSETAGKCSKGDEMDAPEIYDTVPSTDVGSANKKLKLHDRSTPGTSNETLSSAGSRKYTEHACRSLLRELRGHRRSTSPSDPDFVAYLNGEQRYPYIHHKTKPSLDAILRYQEDTGLTVEMGKYTPEEDFILLKNIHEIVKYYDIGYPHMIVGHCGDQDPALQKEVQDFVRKEQLIRVLGRKLPCRTIHSAYMRARILLDPLASRKKVVLNRQQKKRLQRMYDCLGPKWTVMAQKMGLSAEQCRSAFRHVKEKKTFATGKWQQSEDELLRQAVERQTGGRSVLLKDINWQAVSKRVGSRNASQCRRRWTLIQLTPPPGQKARKWGRFDSIHLIYM